MKVLPEFAIKFAIVVFLVYRSIDQFLMVSDGDQFADKFNNSCETEGVKQIDSIVCSERPGTFTNFIWFMLDGLAFDQIYPEIQKYSQQANIYRILNPEYLQSAAIHETYVTGKPSKNYAASQTNVETIFDQIRDKTKIHTLIHSTSFPVYAMIQEGRFSTSILEPRGPRYLMEYFCPNIMINPRPHGHPATLSQDNMTEIIDYWDGYFAERNKDRKAEDIRKCMVDRLPADQTHSGEERVMKSLKNFGYLFYTSKFDGINHAHGKLHRHTVKAVASFWNDVRLILDYANDPSSGHPLIIMSSDHGGQIIDGEDELHNHGTNDNGNEAFMFIYHPTFENTYSPDAKFLDSTSVASTVSQYLKIGNPLMAEGAAAPVFDTDESKFIAFRSSELQVLERIKLFVDDQGIPKSLLDIQGIDQDKDFAELDKTSVEKLLEKYPAHLEDLYHRARKLSNTNVFKRNIDILLGILVAIIFSSCGFSKYRCLFSCQLGSSPCFGFSTTLKLVCLSASCWLVAVYFEIFDRKTSHFVGVATLLLLAAFVELKNFISDKEYCLIPSFSSQKEHSDITRLEKVILFFRPGMRLELVYLIWMFIGNIILRANILTQDIDILDKSPVYFINFALFLMALMVSLLMKRYFSSDPKQEQNGSLFSRLFRNPRTIISFCVVCLSLCYYYENYLKRDELREFRQKFYIFFAIYFVLSNIAFFHLKNPRSQFENDTERPNSHFSQWNHNMVNLMMFLFWLNNNRNRFYILTFLWPCLEVLGAVIADISAHYADKRPRIAYLMILTAFNAYTLMNNSYGLEISLRAGSRTWGESHDETPIFTGVIFGVHKMSFFLIASVIIGKMLKMSWTDWCIDFKTMTASSPSKPSNSFSTLKGRQEVSL